MSTSTLTIEKLANAFVPNAEPASLLGGVPRFAIRQYEKKHGGLWIGGKVAITPDGVSFGANAMNRALHKDLADTVIPLESIRSVRLEFGWVTSIVVVEHAGGEFRFRCFHAREVADTLAAQLPH